MAASQPAGPRRREAEVIAAAVEVFNAKGFAAATTQDIADRLGMLKGSLYYYIRSKEELLARIFDRVNAEAREILLEVAALDAPALERLERYVARYTLWYLTQFDRVGLYFVEWRHLTGELLATELDRRAEFETFVRELIVAAQREGAVDPALSAQHATLFLLGGINSAATWYRADGADPPERIAASYARLAVGGLLTAPSTAP